MEESPLTVACQYIEQVLEDQQESGTSREYYGLINEILGTSEDSDAVFRARWIQALSMCVASLDPDYHMDLIQTILSLKWTESPQPQTQSLWVNLLSVYPQWTQRILQIALGFLRAPCPEDELGTLPASPSQFDGLHVLAAQTVSQALRIVPQSSKMYLSHFKKQFPHHSLPSAVLYRFVGAGLQTAQAFRSVRSGVLSTILEKMLEIDVELSTEMESTEDEMDMAGRTETASSHTGRLMNTLDLLFQQVMQFIAMSPADDLSADFMNMGRDFLLTTHKCKYVQFLWFYFASQREESAKEFLDTFASIAFDPHQPKPIQITSAAYIGSFLARGLTIPTRVVQESIIAITEYLLNYIRLHGQRQERFNPDVHRHVGFYALSQTLFYALCFLFPSLDEDFLVQLELDQIVRSTLNPLMVTLPTVRDEFVRLSEYFGVLNCADVVHKNRRLAISRRPYLIPRSSSLPTMRFTGDDGTSIGDEDLKGAIAIPSITSIAHEMEEWYASPTISYVWASMACQGAANQGGSSGSFRRDDASLLDLRHSHFDQFFPFDPSFLPATRHIIEPLYRKWDMVEEKMDATSSVGERFSGMSFDGERDRYLRSGSGRTVSTQESHPSSEMTLAMVIGSSGGSLALAHMKEGSGEGEDSERGDDEDDVDDGRGDDDVDDEEYDDVFGSISIQGIDGELLPKKTK
eukprot:TRINITY_DN764_c0_g1_i1.p1 TRINITY_DN764_c0_g1~~TRINITY_DN764_c0_g1_i1.p1  ORF type:complete len:690 (-),score=164.95 TRINITY_DN764_c0_g1_i1:24-2093(-)